MRTAAILIVAWSATANADATVDDLAAQGEQLAKAGRFTEAIDAFKQADRIESRASHACLIALVYIRRELWPQAEVFLTICHDRANDEHPVPDWVPLADKQLVERLASAKVAAVKIRIGPERLAKTARIAVSSFAPDELFAPRTIHLAFGTHLITATAAGGRSVQKTIHIVDKTPREIHLDFDERSEAKRGSAPRGIDANEQPTPEPTRPPARQSRVVPWTVIALGGVFAVAGGAYHMFAFKPTRDRLADATDGTPDPTLYDDNERQFDLRRNVTIALYGIGAAALITGVVLRYTAYRDQPETGARVSAQLLTDGALVGLEWRR